MKGQMAWTAGSTAASVTPQLRHQRVLWQEAHEPSASSEERGPTPALPPARGPPHTGKATPSSIANILTVEFDQDAEI